MGPGYLLPPVTYFLKLTDTENYMYRLVCCRHENCEFKECLGYMVRIFHKERQKEERGMEGGREGDL